MIEIGIVIGGAFAFYKYAKEHGLVAWIWAIVPIIAYLTGAFVTGLVLALTAPEILNDQILLTVIALFSGALFVGIAYFIMTRIAANKANSDNTVQSEVLDDEMIS